MAELASLYFQSYQLAFETARRAERAFRFERYESSRTFVRFGAWENLRKGLLAGERLALDLRRMELAFLQEDRRELELVRHLSLAELDPEALVRLRQTGHCSVTVPERVFDEDTPGHLLAPRSQHLADPSLRDRALVTAQRG
ncbi:MAG: hypothetical protein IPJ34_42175 [Myxococcales bacterium]|nr:hypothetical protein [Myxococcales bacterium]